MPKSRRYEECAFPGKNVRGNKYGKKFFLINRTGLVDPDVEVSMPFAD